MKLLKAFDGFKNLLKGFGGANDTREQTGYYRSLRHTRFYPFLEELYETSWAMAKIIDIPVQDSLREGREFPDFNDSQTEEYQEFLETYVDPKVSQAMKYSRLYGACAIVIVTKEGDYSTPLAEIKKGGLVNLAVVDASRLIPQEINYNILSPMFLKSEYYLIAESASSVHHSRVILIQGTETTINALKEGRGFGLSEVERVYSNLQDAIQTTTALRNLVEQSNLDIVGIEGLNEAVAMGSEGEEAMRSRLQVLSSMKSILNTIAIDKEDTYTNIAKNFGTLDSIQMNMFQILSAAADIPYTRFMGASADGMNATGEGDLRNYYDVVVGEIQKEKLRPLYRVLDPIVQQHLWGREVSTKFMFKPLWQLSEKERAEVDQVKANTHSVYLDMGVIDEEAVLEELQGEGRFTNMKLNLIDFDNEEEE